jgi:pilus assembly protein CpaC
MKNSRMKKIFVTWTLIMAFALNGFSIFSVKQLSFAAIQKKGKYQRSKLTSDESESVADQRRLVLSTGEDKTVDLDFDPNPTQNGIAYGNPVVVQTTLVRLGEKRQLVFKPLKAGESTVTVRDNEGTIRVIFHVRVLGSNLLRLASEMRTLLRDIEGIEIRIVGAKIVVEGDVLTPADYGKLFTVITDKVYSDSVINMTGLSPMTMQVIAKKIQDDVQSFAPKVTTRVVNGMIFLEGSVNKEDDAKRALMQASLYLPDLRPGSPLEKDSTVQRLAGRSLIQNFIVVNPQPPKKQDKLVRVSVHFVELAKDYNKNYGFAWQPGFSGQPQITIGQTQGGATGATGPSFAGIITNLFPSLDSAQAAGYARILKAGTVIVRSGQNAKIEETTDYPFLQTNGAAQAPTSSSKSVGLVVAVTPQVLGDSEDIQLDLELTQSSLVGKAPVGGAPTTSNQKVQTKIYIKSSESAAVAGISLSDVGTDFNKDSPSQSSTIFNLYRSKAYRKKKSQFVVFVTPQIVENASEGTEDLKKNFRIKVR